MLDRRTFYIGGAWVAPREGTDFPVEDPSREEPFATIALAGPADTDAAVAAARRAFPGWAATPPAERIALVERLLEAYRAREEEMAETISREMGAPIDLSRAAQAPAGTEAIADYLEAVRDFAFERPLRADTPHDRILMEPAGVCALITPWNWPMNQVALKVVPALLAGCTMVLKPSEIAPLSGALFAEIVDAAGAPPGVFNLVHGDGAGAGSRLSAHPEIDMVSFTGSTRAGTAISKAAADTLKRVHLELGGKGANILFEDAPAGAAERGTAFCFENTGQSCNAPTRMLVHRARYEEAVETAARVAEATGVGPADRRGDHIGPAVSAAQREKIERLVQIGIDEGARLVAGGPGRPEGLNRGHFVRPTVFADVSNDMTIAREEVFGPVLSIIPFETEEEAVAIANDTPYGLTNYVESDDPERRNRVARRLRSGMVEMNGMARSSGSPFGGMKASGNGREGGVWGIEDFCEVKAVSGWGET